MHESDLSARRGSGRASQPVATKGEIKGSCAPPDRGRRRVLRMIAAAPALALWPGALRAAPRPSPVRWRGRLMGAEASLAVYAQDRPAAEAAVAEAVACARRLESLFSLYRPDSALVRLNSSGRLARPDPEFLSLLKQADHMHQVTGGLFNPLVGVLFDRYLAHFAAHPFDETGLPQGEIARIRPLLDWAALRWDDQAVRLPPGAKLTFNGIAQGYVSDRVCALLERRGFQPLLINFGEYRALGRHPAGRPFRVGMADPRRPGRLLGSLPVAQALAASSPLAASFDEDGRFHHLINPVTGRPAPAAPPGVWVAARDATTADALSTALAVAPPGLRRALLRRIPGSRAWILGSDGALAPLAA